jgi:hypothetical protein
MEGCLNSDLNKDKEEKFIFQTVCLKEV